MCNSQTAAPRFQFSRVFGILMVASLRPFDSKFATITFRDFRPIQTFAPFSPRVVSCDSPLVIFCCCQESKPSYESSWHGHIAIEKQFKWVKVELEFHLQLISENIYLQHMMRSQATHALQDKHPLAVTRRCELVIVDQNTESPGCNF